MRRTDVLVVGGGIAGACFAFHAARAGEQVLVVERDGRPGGCLHSVRTPSGFWYELGAHTCYNSYGALLEVLEACGLLDRLLPRAKPVLRFLDGDCVLPGKNLGLLLRRFEKLELLRALPRWFRAEARATTGKTVRQHYASLVGARNYARVLGPMLSAVPSQPADDFPADLLFKRRERRKDVLRSFTIDGGLQGLVEAIVAQPGIELVLESGARGIARSGERFVVTLASGEELEADVLALAVPPNVAADLLADAFPDVSAAAAPFAQARVESLGFAVRAEATDVPFATFLIPQDDSFHSVVTRDVVPDTGDPPRRAFTLHFRPGLTAAARRERAGEVLGISADDMEDASERATVLPSPTLGHASRIAALDTHLAGGRLALTGNWFGGLSIEDCALRSRAEWRRVGASSGAVGRDEGGFRPADGRPRRRSVRGSVGTEDRGR